MPDRRATEPAEIQALSVQYPKWKIWASSAGVVMASRRRDLTRTEINAGLALTLPFGAEDESLRDQLAEQARIEKTLEETP